ncbi:ATP-binding protein [Paenibacillus mesophilus]|uniref:ATP-binding protein n=1 Tax=Paenibacillus mesophilus TaxID=2582849 RepID=UPI00110D81D1|nr:ATP-binding protein [Paenibacillus mesophilus]TMV51543.1 ATP-binding protein [Paenibacillus mesophilus]
MTIKSLKLRNELRELETMRLFLEESARTFCFDERLLYRLNLICDELVTNIISYGYDENAEVASRIEIILSHTPECLEISITDDGAAFNPLNKQEPDLNAGIDERKIGGLGIHFVKTLTNKAVYERQGKRNILRLTINRHQEPEEEQTG